MSKVEFKVTQFSSGEYEVTIEKRIYGDTATIHWNWFNETERDVFQLLLKIEAVKTTYPNLKIIVDAPYLPYMRQDRLFNAGTAVPSFVLTDLLKNYSNVEVITMACHSPNTLVDNRRIHLQELKKIHNIVFPDLSAVNHFHLRGDYYCFSKIRDKLNNNVSLDLTDMPRKIHTELTYLICDDICAGGRTFIECAKALKNKFPYQLNIELLVYHAFLDHGLDALKQSGITKIHILNKDSYDYVLKQYPGEEDYIKLLPEMYR